MGFEDERGKREAAMTIETGETVGTIAKPKKKRKPRRMGVQIPGAVSAAEMGGRIKRAMEEAGYLTQEQIRYQMWRQFPKIDLTPSSISAMTRGYKMPRVDRILTIAMVLKLDVKILFPELFDSDGEPIRFNYVEDRLKSG